MHLLHSGLDVSYQIRLLDTSPPLQVRPDGHVTLVKIDTALDNNFVLLLLNI